MTKAGLFLTMSDQTEVFIHNWADLENPQGILQIAHGMAEHGGRYARFAKFCNEQGFVVVASDHRGHGRTGEKSGLMGYFHPEDGFERVVDDLFEINQWIGKQFTQLPIFLLGHSMGSFLTRRYIQKYGESIKGAILMGSGGDPGLAAKLGKLIARLQMLRNPTKPSALLDTLSFGGFNRSIKNPTTRFDWLTRDMKEVQKYMDDPYCGMVCSAGFFYDLFTGLEKIHNPKLIEKIPKQLPLLVLSGEADPVGKNGAGIRQFVAQLEKHGLEKIETIFYPEARHELLNETNRDEVLEDMGRWLQQQLTS